ncbi:MAG: GMC family oxidoreductase [Bdellovibrio sp.]
MKYDYDYIVIGSGFGGSVMTCRLVEKGYKVCLLERGRKWKMHEFPRRPQDFQQNIFWNPRSQKFGLMEFRDSPESDVLTLTASGLGGGSLIYANVLYRMPEMFFKDWPGQITRQTLEPYYTRVLSTMEARPYPFESSSYYRNTPKTALLKKVAEQLTPAAEALHPPQFKLPDLAVRFEGEFPGHQTRNKHGALQSRCNKCGDCDIGCNIHAKNTLDLNYLYRAQHLAAAPHRADIRTHAEVIRIQHHGDHYSVTYVIPEYPLQENTFTARKVILSAGSLGSTSLLLKMKKAGHLPRLNDWLGKKWCGNGDLLSFVFNTKPTVDATNGPVITGAIEYAFKEYADGYPHGLYLQEAGCPQGFGWYIAGKIPQIQGLQGLFNLFRQSVKKYLLKIAGWKYSSTINVGEDFANILDHGHFTKKCLLLLGMGRDRSDGEIRLREDNETIVHWKMKSSRSHFQRLRTEMKKVADILGGVYVDNPLTHLNKIVSVHPLGGCPMGDSPEEGLVSPLGEVYGYEGLYVVDGSIIPTSTGPNPSLTIAALAERIADHIPVKMSEEESAGLFSTIDS